MVRTRGFQPCNRGSIPLGGTKNPITWSGFCIVLQRNTNLSPYPPLARPGWVFSCPAIAGRAAVFVCVMVLLIMTKICYTIIARGQKEDLFSFWRSPTQFQALLISINQEVALTEHPDLISLDLLMPVLDGIGFLKKLREDDWGKTAEVIFWTKFSYLWKK